MRTILREYSKYIVSVILVLGVIGIIFLGINIYQRMSDFAEDGSTISVSQADDALEEYASLEKPTFTFNRWLEPNKVYTIYYRTSFKPASYVSAVDSNGNELDVKITSIKAIPTNGLYSSVEERIDFLPYYNEADDLLLIDREHYSEEHKMCSVDEHQTPSNLYNEDAIVYVTYMATDANKMSNTVTLCFHLGE